MAFMRPTALRATNIFFDSSLGRARLEGYTFVYEYILVLGHVFLPFFPDQLFRPSERKKASLAFSWPHPTRLAFTIYVKVGMGGGPGNRDTVLRVYMRAPDLPIRMLSSQNITSRGSQGQEHLLCPG